MTIVRYGWSILDRNSPHPELMQRMMQRMAVNAVTAMRIDGGMAWSEARTKCIFCRHEEECRHWLDGSEAPQQPADFCPIIEFFGRCADTDAHHAFNAITEAFLVRHLGGRSEPVGDDFKGSSHEIRVSDTDLG